MRLIRCTTENNEGRFNGQLNDDVTLEPGSSIALKSLSCEIAPPRLDLRYDADRVLTWSVNGTSVNTLSNSIPAQVYEDSTADELDKATKAALNRSMYYNMTGAAAFTRASTGGFEQQCLGAQWDVSVGNDNNTLITLKKGQIGTQADQFMNSENRSDNVQIANVNTVQLNTVQQFSASAASPAAPQVMFCRDPISSGTGFFECLGLTGLYDPATADPDRNGFMLGLSYTNLSELTPAGLVQKLDEIMDYGIGMAFEAATDHCRLMYQYRNAGGVTVGPAEINQGNLGKALTADDQNNARVRLQISDGIVWFMTTNGPSTAIGNLVQSTVIGMPTQNAPPLGERPLYPFVVFYTDIARTSIAELNVSLAPVGDNIPGVTPPAGSDPALWPLTPLFVDFTSSLTFPTDSFASFLGYKTRSLPANGVRTATDFVALSKLPFLPRVLTSDIMVLCESFELDSYDTSQRQRKSILSVIPVSADMRATGVVIERGDENFIDIKNLAAQTFRNLRFRLVDSNYNPLAVNGESALVVLTKHKEE